MFRTRLRESPSSVTWRKLYDVISGEGELLDRFSTCGDEMVSGDGYRLLWFQSARKAALDAATRNRQLQQASAALAELQEGESPGHGHGFAARASGTGRGAGSR